MQTLKESLEIKISEKIRNSKESEYIEKIIKKNAQEVVFRKYEKGFYDRLYESVYSTELKKKPFACFGPGSFRHSYWTNIDRRYNGHGWTEVRRFSIDNTPDIEWNFFSKQQLPVDDNSFYLAYCSHVIEHGFDEDVKFLLNEIYRTLKKNGIIRLVCPDAEIFYEMYSNKEFHQIINYLSVRSHRIPYTTMLNQKYDLELHSIYFILDMFSLLRNKKNPVFLENKEAIDFFKRNNFYKALDIAQNFSSRELQHQIAGHVNWFTFEKLSYFLQQAGFKNIKKRGYLQSANQLFQDPILFDKTDKEFSIYVEAQK